MNHLLDTDMDEAEATPEREISLGAGTILGIFFGLVLVCGAFLGFGYTLGRRAAVNVAPAVIAPPVTLATSGTKPAAGTFVPAVSPATPAKDSTQPTSAPALPETPVAKSTPTPADAAATAPQRTAPAATPQAAALPGISSTGTFMVQIAAVSTKEIADTIVDALKKHGYDVIVRHEPADQLLHIQLGPFATRKDAEAMRQNVLSHGFNAIVK